MGFANAWGDDIMSHNTPTSKIPYHELQQRNMHYWFVYATVFSVKKRFAQQGAKSQTTSAFTRSSDKTTGESAILYAFHRQSFYLPVLETQAV